MKEDYSWLWNKSKIETETSYVPFYGDVTDLNTERTILDCVEKETMKSIVSDLMDLLETSVAVYEKNGDYAFGMFVSGWCQVMDSASRRLCNTEDNKKALTCGKWLCHENCWNDSAKKAIETGKSTDINCIGGIKLYAEPIIVKGEVVGTINIGYGNPPKSEEKLKKLAKEFNVKFDDLKKAANEYNSRPEFLINLSKKRLKNTARLIAELIIDKKKSKQIEESEDKIRSILENTTSLFYKHDINHKLSYLSPQVEDILGYTPEEAMVVWTELATDDEINEIGYNKTVKAIETGKHQEPYELELRHKNGRKVRVEIRESPVVEDGKTVAIVGSATDITEKKQAEQILKESEERFKTLFNNNPNPTYIWKFIDNELTLYDYNQTAIEFTKGKIHEIKGITLSQMYKDNIHIYNDFMDCFEQQTSISREFNYTYKTTGEERFLNTKYTFVHPDYLMVITEDITDQKLAEQALKESEEKLRLIGNNIPKGQIFQLLVKPDGRNQFTYISKKVEELHECTVEEAMTDPGLLFGRVLPEDVPGLQAVTEKSIQEMTEFDHNVRMRRKNGEIRWHRMISKPRELENGDILFDGIDFDITDIKNAESQLIVAKEKAEQSEKKYIDLFMNMTNGFAIHKAIVDESGEPIDYIVTKINSAYEKITGFTSDKILNKRIKEVLPQLDDEWVKLSGKVALTGKPALTEIYSKPLDKHFFISLFSPEKGYSASIFSDITKVKKAEKEIIKAKERAEKADKLKSAFLANMSHEIRTPLNTIIGFTDLLQRREFDKDKLNSYIKIMNQNGHGLLNIINDILELSRIDAGVVKLQKEPFVLKDLVYQIEETYLPMTRRKGNIHFGVNFSDEIREINFIADKDRMLQVINNLMGNAIKFTKKGAIEFNVFKKDNELCFAVSDTGIGISENDQKIIFDRFIRIEDKNEETIQGTGLGLSITKTLAELMGGRISVKSEINKGSCFTFTLPLEEYKPVLKKNKEIEKERFANKKKILIADDDVSNLYFLEEVLSMIDCEIHKAVNGIEVIEILKKEDNFDYVILDLKMPKMDGFECAGEIKKLNIEARIIALSAFAFEDDIKKAKEAGCDDYIKKPVDIDVLMKAIC